MEVIRRLTTMPENSIISNGFGRIDYCDSYRIVKVANDTAEEIAAQILKPAKWGNRLMSIRDSAVKIFGLKTSKQIIEGFITGFPITEKHDSEIVMGENDKHLDNCEIKFKKKHK